MCPSRVRATAARRAGRLGRRPRASTRAGRTTRPDGRTRHSAAGIDPSAAGARPPHERLPAGARPWPSRLRPLPSLTRVRPRRTSAARRSHTGTCSSRPRRETSSSRHRSTGSASTTSAEATPTGSDSSKTSPRRSHFTSIRASALRGARTTLTRAPIAANRRSRTSLDMAFLLSRELLDRRSVQLARSSTQRRLTSSVSSGVLRSDDVVQATRQPFDPVSPGDGGATVGGRPTWRSSGARASYAARKEQAKAHAYCQRSFLASAQRVFLSQAGPRFELCLLQAGHHLGFLRGLVASRNEEGDPFGSPSSGSICG
jgi:hypothetical protein